MSGLGLPGITAWAKGAQHFNPNLEAYDYDLYRARELLAITGYDIEGEENPNDGNTTYSPTHDQDDNLSSKMTDPDLIFGLSFSNVVVVKIFPIIMINSIRRKSISK